MQYYLTEIVYADGTDLTHSSHIIFQSFHLIFLKREVCNFPATSSTKMEFINNNNKKLCSIQLIYGDLEHLNGFHNIGSANHVSLGAGLCICLTGVF